MKVSKAIWAVVAVGMLGVTPALAQDRPARPEPKAPARVERPDRPERRDPERRERPDRPGRIAEKPVRPGGVGEKPVRPEPIARR